LPPSGLAGLCPACLLKEGASADTATQGQTKPFEPPTVAELARLFPQLEILALLGKGGMGAVYKARQPALDRFVALKILPSRGESGAGFAERFTREARALARLSHPHIVAVHEFGQVGGAGGSTPLHYFIMEYVDGVNLRQLEKTGRLSPREALQIIPQICDALQYAHDEGVVHRDIKPENVLVDRKGRVKIADFGLAKILNLESQEWRLTGEGEVMGTPHYMAPEQIERPLEVDHRADIFSVGVVFYEMLTGQLPLGKFAPPSSCGRGLHIDVRLDEVVLHALEKEPARRYQQVGEVKTAIQHLGTGSAADASGGASAQAMMAVPRWALGVEYRSKASLFGWPLLHVATGMDPATGRGRHARGIVAIGNTACGLIAFGGVAIGGLAFGGLALGGLACGGGAIGLLAFGGLAVALLAAIGGGAIGPVAMGGGALGYWAFGGGALAVHGCSGLKIDPVAWNFFEPWIDPFMRDTYCAGLGLAAVTILAAALVPAWLQRRDPQVIRRAGYWGQLGLALFMAAFCVATTMTFGRRLPRLWLISGTVTMLPEGWVTWSCPARPTAKPVEVENGSISFISPQPQVEIKAGAPGFVTIPLRLNQSSFDRKRHALVSLGPFVPAQTWSPSYSPETKQDVQQIIHEAHQLMEEGKYGEAMQRLIWCYDHRQELDAASPWSPLLNCLSDWIELGRRYPEAKEALLAIRDQKAKEFAEGRGYFELFLELSNINQYLQYDQNTLAVFNKLAQSDHALAAQCFPVTRPVFVKFGQYKACMNFIGDPQAAFEGAQRMWEMQKQSEERMAGLWRKLTNENPNLKTPDQVQAEQNERLSKQIPGFKPPPRAHPPTANDRFIGDVRQLVEILVGAAQEKEAIRIQDEAVALLDDARLKSAVSDARASIAKPR